MRIAIYFVGLTLCLLTNVALQSQNQSLNNILKGRVLYQNSNGRPVPGVYIKDEDSNPVYSKNRGDYILTFQNKRSGANLVLTIGKDNAKGQKIDLVNEKEVQNAKLPSDPNAILDIIVCPAGQRDIVAQRYYNIIKTTRDKELRQLRHNYNSLVAEKKLDWEQLQNLYAQLDEKEKQLDSAKIREQAIIIASINRDKSSKAVKKALKKLDLGEDIEAILDVLDKKEISKSWRYNSRVKKQADLEIKQAVEAYELTIKLLAPRFRYREIEECYDSIIIIFETENYNRLEIANYHLRLGEVALDNGEYQKAIQNAQKVIAILEKELPPLHPELATAYNNLGSCYSKSGDFKLATKYFEAALDIREKILQPLSPDLATTYNDIGLNFEYLGDLKNALLYLEKSFEIRKKVLPPFHRDLGYVYSNLGGIYSRLGDNKKALEYAEKSFEIDKHILSPLHPELAKSYNNVGVIYGRLGDHKKSLEYKEKALEIYTQVLPPTHPMMAVINNNIGHTYAKLGRLNQALIFHKKSLEIRMEIYPSDHPSLSLAYNNLGDTYNLLQDYENALKCQIQSSEIHLKTLPYVHHNLATTYSNIGTTYNNMKKYDKGIEFLEKSLEIKFKVYPPVHPSIALTYNNMAFSYGKLGNFNKALEFQLKSLEIYKQISPVPVSDLLVSYQHVGMLWAKIQNFEKAKEAFEKYQELEPGYQSWQNWSLFYALKNDKSSAFECLHKAISAGLRDLTWLITEECFESIRNEPEYKEIVEQLRKR